ncbi:PrpF domain-containing protein [Pseudonocardia nematodicida]|uniref:PrpF domain-containing protein n=1 Tax=Pseudonocardia nematodicida TaxID=1206997 RepID=A0ABV1KH84_9PSEU
MQIPAVLMRGGTSKCWVFDERDLDRCGLDRDTALLRVYGSPDPRQIDGVGGATSTTSKAAVVAPSGRDGIDVDYTFAQIGIAEGKVDWSNNCGNCSSVVGLHAVQQGWVAPRGEVTRVVVYNTNTGKTILQDVPTPDRRPTNAGDAMIIGVPFPGPRIELGFVDPSGAVTGRLLPTGRPQEKLTGRRGTVRATLVDAANPMALLWGPDIGLSGTEDPAAVDADAELLADLAEYRAQASELMGIAPEAASADTVSRAIPKLAWIAPAPDPAVADAAVRMLSMGRTHPALAITGLVAVTGACSVPGSVAPPGTDVSAGLRILSPSGVIGVRSETNPDGSLSAVFVERTARRIATAELEAS